MKVKANNHLPTNCYATCPTPSGAGGEFFGFVFVKSCNLKIKMSKLHNRPYLKAFRKQLRNNSTSSEATLWKMIKNKQVAGLKFRRQHSVGNYILDFYCPALKLAIELDGEPHVGFAAEEKDRERDRFLNQAGIEVLHFENRWVFEYPQDIVEEILKFMSRNVRGI